MLMLRPAVWTSSTRRRGIAWSWLRPWLPCVNTSTSWRSRRRVNVVDRFEAPPGVLVQRIVDEHGGTARSEDSRMGGAAFVDWFPKERVVP